MHKTPTRLFLFLILTCGSQFAHADFLSGLKDAVKEDATSISHARQSNGFSLGSLLSGDSAALSSSSSANVAGILQYCIQHNLLSASSTSSVKDKLMSKLGLSEATAKKDPDYLDGLKGMLHSPDNGKLDLSKLGGSAAQLKEKVQQNACDVILSQSASFL